MKIAIIGANGAIGSVLVNYFEKFPEYQIVAIMRNSMGKIFIEGAKCEIRYGSISDAEESKTLLKDCNIAINCAIASGNVRAAKKINSAIIDNIKNSNITKLIHFSTQSVYGTCLNKERSTFKSPLPDTPYGKSKFLLEKYITSTWNSSNKNYYILRLGRVYGPHQNTSKEIITNINNNLLLPFNGDILANAINIFQIGPLLKPIIDTHLEKGVYNLSDYPQKTWRIIFNEHSDCLNKPYLESLDKARSEKLKNEYFMIEKKENILSFIRLLIKNSSTSVFSSIVTTSTQNRAGKKVLSDVLQFLPEIIEKKLKLINNKHRANREINSFKKSSATNYNPSYFADAMPGKYLTEIGPFSNEQALQNLKKWVKQYTEPKW